MHITETSGKRAWRSAMRAIRTHGVEFEDERGNICCEALNMTITVNDPATIHEPLLTMTSKNSWHYPSADELKAIIVSPSKGSFPYTYGSRIQTYGGSLDQIHEYILPLLTGTPHSRRALIQVWDPLSDCDADNRHVPGLITIDLKLRDGKLHVTGIVRSADVFFGWPANVYQLSIIQEQIAAKLGAKPGPITTVCTSAHVFSYQYKEIDRVLEEEEVGKDAS